MDTITEDHTYYAATPNTCGMSKHNMDVLNPMVKTEPDEMQGNIPSTTNVCCLPTSDGLIYITQNPNWNFNDASRVEDTDYEHNILNKKCQTIRAKTYGNTEIKMEETACVLGRNNNAKRDCSLFHKDACLNGEFSKQTQFNNMGYQAGNTDTVTDNGDISTLDTDNQVLCIRQIDQDAKFDETSDLELFLSEEVVPGRKYNFVKVDRNVWESIQHNGTVDMGEINETQTDATTHPTMIDSPTTTLTDGTVTSTPNNTSGTHINGTMSTSLLTTNSDINKDMKMPSLSHYSNTPTTKDESVSVQKGNDSHVCPICLYKTTHLSQIKLHYKLHVGQKVFRCPRVECGVFFQIRSQWACHMHAKHPGEQFFLCSSCNYGCGTVHEIKQHRRHHSTETPFKCNACSKSFKSPANLRHHTKAHDSARPYKCNQCPFATQYRDGLRKHILTHSDERHFLCNHCAFTCKTAFGLDVHIRTHTGDKRYSCPHCPYKCVQGQNLTKHIEVHDTNRQSENVKRRSQKRVRNETKQKNSDNAALSESQDLTTENYLHYVDSCDTKNVK